jgi:hypothetical protein
MADYNWDDAERDIRAGIHPETVASRLRENIQYVIEVATRKDWGISYKNKPKTPYLVRNLGV